MTELAPRAGWARHFGLNNNSDKTHFGFDGNDLNGGASAIVPGVWYHVAWVYDTALKDDQILAIYHGTAPDAMPAAGTYYAPRSLYGYRGSAGNWGVREIKGYPGIGCTSLVDADRILKANAATPGGTIASYWTTVLNAIDDEGAGATGYFANEGDLATNTAGPDDGILMLARCTVRIPAAGNYTFGFRGERQQARG